MVGAGIDIVDFGTAIGAIIGGVGIAGGVMPGGGVNVGAFWFVPAIGIAGN